MADGEPVHAPSASTVRRRTLLHSVGPLGAGAVLGALWQALVSPLLGSSQLPNPVHGALVLGLCLSPLVHVRLVQRPLAEWWEYAVGWAAVAVPISLAWLSQSMGGRLFCGVYAVALVWMGLSGAWSAGDWERTGGTLPPFRFGLWHTLGLAFGGFLGSVLLYAWS